MERDWSTLPTDILVTIATRLNSHISLLRLRAVCPSWRTSVPLSLSPDHNHPFPLLTPPPPTPNKTSFYTRGKCSVAKFTILRLSPLSSPTSPSHLIKISPSHPNTTTTFSLLNPLTTAKLQNPNLTSINLLNFRVTEVTHSYSLQFTQSAAITVKKVAVIPSSTNNSFTVLLSFGPRVYRWKTGESSWTLIHDVNSKYNKGRYTTEKNCYFDLNDWLYYDNHWYAVNLFGTLMRFDSGNFTPTEITQYPLGNSPGETYSLVLSENRSLLYLVGKISDEYDYEADYDYDGMELKVTVYKMGVDWERKKKERIGWEECERLGGKVLVVGEDVSFSVSSKDFKGCCQPDSVYLTDDCFQGENEDDACYQFPGLYALGKRLVVSLDAAPELAKLFWPPPSWLLTK